MTIFEKKKNEAQAVLSTKRFLKGKRQLLLERKYLISMEEVYQGVRKVEIRTQEQKNKIRKKISK